MVRGIFLSLCLIGAMSVAQAKPLLLNSEDTYASVCMEGSETYDRLIPICQNALDAPGSSRSQRLEMMDTLAWAYDGTGDRPRALELFNEMLELSPASTQALQGLGWIAWEVDDYDAALTHFEKALGLDYSAESLAGAASTRFRMGQASIDETAAALEAATAMDPEYVWPLRELGWLQIDEGAYEAAAKAFRGALAVHFDDTNALYGLSHALRETGRSDLALEQINRALEYYPEDYEYLFERGLNLFLVGHNRVADNEADKLIEMRPEDSSGYVLKARVLASQGAALQAFDLLETFRQDVEPEPWLSYWLVSLYQDDGRDEDALRMLQQILDENEEPRSYHYSLVFDSALATENYIVARQAVDAMLQADPDARTVYLDAVVMAHETLFDDAEKRVEEALSLGHSADDLSDFYGALAKQGQYLRIIGLKVKLKDQDSAVQN